MTKRIILAVAGAGKTHYICHSIDRNQRNLILAFTNENIYNIRKELSSAYGNIPKLTCISTFDSFVYHELILPFEPSIAHYFGCPSSINCGITTIDPPKTRRCIEGRTVYSPKYRKNEFSHYVTSRREYYCATLSELALLIKNGRSSLISRAATRLNIFYDHILIDEFQDFRENDYRLLLSLADKVNDITLVGDYYQHSVTALNNSGKPFQKRIGGPIISYREFVAELYKQKFDVDTSMLNKSRRCSVDVCDYISKKLNIEITSCAINSGTVILLNDTNSIRKVLNDPAIIKLVYRQSSKYSFNAMNWSYSKGDTFDTVCIILTKTFENLPESNFSLEKIAPISINKLYVAMSRTKGDLYIIRDSDFKKVQDDYLK